MCVWGLFQKCWGSFPLLLRVPPAQPTQREHSYQVQTAICSAGALRHAPHGVESSVRIRISTSDSMSVRMRIRIRNIVNIGKCIRARTSIGIGIRISFAFRISINNSSGTGIGSSRAY